MLISEYTGGGFGSKATGYIFAIIPALLSKKANAPVMMRISREEEHFIGRARPGFQGRMKVGFAKDGRITAVDMYAICNNGPYDAVGDVGASGVIVSLLYQPQAMRWRGITVLTNTPPRGAQSAPGGMQGIVTDGTPGGEGGAQAVGLTRSRFARSTPRRQSSVGAGTRRKARALDQRFLERSL